MHEGGIRSPLIACWPGVIGAGVVSDHITYTPDMMPTLAELPPPTNSFRTIWTGSRSYRHCLAIPTGRSGMTTFTGSGINAALNVRFAAADGNWYPTSQECGRCSISRRTSPNRMTLPSSTWI